MGYLGERHSHSRGPTTENMCNLTKSKAKHHLYVLSVQKHKCQNSLCPTSYYKQLLSHGTYCFFFTSSVLCDDFHHICALCNILTSNLERYQSILLLGTLHLDIGWFSTFRDHKARQRPH